MIKIGIPVVDQHDLTRECIKHLRDNAYTNSVEIIIIDNASDRSYAGFVDSFSSFNAWTGVKFNEYNRGYYWPLLQVCEGTTSADIVGLMHNDLFIYEKGWDRRLMDCFLNDSRLGMVGVCGSDQIDERGGRGAGTMCNFAGRVGQLQAHTGKRVTGVHQAIIFDSMFLAMRRPVVDSLDIDEHITPCHFYDKIWPLKAMVAGWRCAVLGLEVDHMGGQTSVGTRFEEDCQKWCQKEGLQYENGKANLAVYLEAERRFLTYGRMLGFIPSKIR